MYTATRRQFWPAVGWIAGALGIAVWPSLGQSQNDDPTPPLPKDLAASKESEYFDLQMDVKKLGTGKPTAREEELARRVLNGAPFNVKPYEVAKYFRDVGQGSLGEELRPFVSGWPIRYNPVIIEFFKTTRLEALAAKGDATYWCAAFANWCIARANSKDGVIRENDLLLGTRSASSGSFRCFGEETKSPKRGDVVVWAVEGTVNGCKVGSGHVAFYDGEAVSGDKIPVIGGNQSDPALKRSAVTRNSIGRTFTRTEGVVRFHSFRTAKNL